MTRVALFFYISLILGGCVCYPVTQYPDLTVVLYNGDGENVEVFCGEDTIIKLHGIKTDETNVAAVEKIKRVRGRLRLRVEINGKLAGNFSINAQRIGVVYLFLTSEGSVILEDGMKIR